MHHNLLTNGTTDLISDGYLWLMQKLKMVPCNKLICWIAQISWHHQFISRHWCLQHCEYILWQWAIWRYNLFEGNKIKMWSRSYKRLKIEKIVCYSKYIFYFFRIWFIHYICFMILSWHNFYIIFLAFIQQSNH